MTSTTKGIHNTINEFIDEDVRRASLFEAMGIDSCCGGQKTLYQACNEKGLDPGITLKQLQHVEDKGSPEKDPDWSQATLTELVDHIEKKHHLYLKTALPRLTSLIEKVRLQHGARHSELRDLQTAFEELKGDLEPHMMKEEQILFPMVRKLETGEGSTDFHCGTLQGPISVMRAEHDHAKALLEKIRKFSNNFIRPEDGCATYGVMVDELKILTQDLYTHIHKENDILFPKAREME